MGSGRGRGRWRRLWRCWIWLWRWGRLWFRLRRRDRRDRARRLVERNLGPRVVLANDRVDTVGRNFLRRRSVRLSRPGKASVWEVRIVCPAPLDEFELPIKVGHKLCGVNQAAVANAYSRLCSASDGSANQFYFCSDSATSCGGFIRLIDATAENNGTTRVAADELDYCASAITSICISTSLGQDHSSSVIPDTLTGGQSLSAGQSITSANGRYTLIMQGDGNLVLYASNSPLWSSGTNGNSGAYAVMQTDGNFVIYGPGGPAIWASGTWGDYNAEIRMQCDGNLVIYTPSNVPVWDSRTAQPGPCIWE